MKVHFCQLLLKSDNDIIQWYKYFISVKFAIYLLFQSSFHIHCSNLLVTSCLHDRSLAIFKGTRNIAMLIWFRCNFASNFFENLKLWTRPEPCFWWENYRLLNPSVLLIYGTLSRVLIFLEHLLTTYSCYLYLPRLTLKWCNHNNAGKCKH